MHRHRAHTDPDPNTSPSPWADRFPNMHRQRTRLYNSGMVWEAVRHCRLRKWSTDGVRLRPNAASRCRPNNRLGSGRRPNSQEGGLLWACVGRFRNGKDETVCDYVLTTLWIVEGTTKGENEGDGSG